MNDDHLRERKISSRKLFSGLVLNLHSDEVLLPDGSIGIREYALHPGAVVIIPFLPNGNIVLERQFRYPVNRVVVELPAGKLDGEEDALECGKRELLEETGYVSEKWSFVTRFHPVCGYSNEVMHIFLAEDVVYQRKECDVGEFVEVIDMSFEEAMGMVRNGDIDDAKTIIGLFWMDKIRSGKWDGGKSP